MTTRQYHRNSDLAFPKTADYGCAVTRPSPRSKLAEGAVWVAIACGGVAAIISMIWG